MERARKTIGKGVAKYSHFIGFIKSIASKSIPELKKMGMKDNILELPGSENPS